MIPFMISHMKILLMLMATITVSHGCRDGYYGVDCNKLCDVSCKTCSNGYSCDNCPDGKYKTDTFCSDCPPNCATCTDYNDCTSCKDGYYSYRCGNSCPGNCKCTHQSCPECRNGFYDTSDLCYKPCVSTCKTCNSNTVCESCPDGRYGSQCQNSCLSGCKTCYNGQNCVECYDGYWGLYCHQQCSPGCTDGRCNVDGTCTCKSERYQGTTCRTCALGYYWTDNGCARCSPGCSLNCNSSSGQCACIGGYNGIKCNLCLDRYYMSGRNCFSCNQNCKICDNGMNCSSCASGFYGSNCNNPCSPNCDSPTCHQTTGHCFGCRPGFHGDQCELNCSSGCEATGCYKATGRCIDCKIDYYGNFCNQICPDKCAPNNNCTRDMEYCIGCLDGYYNNTCDAPCPTNCDSSGCDQMFGNCYRCDDGYEGARCQFDCSNCKTGTCTNYVCEECVEGFSGALCDNECATGCKACDQGDESVCTTCKTGLYGMQTGVLTCHLECNDLCRDRVCDGITGKCLAGCRERYWGDTCQLSCSVGCIEGQCHQNNGTCIAGCVDGKTGALCQDDCAGRCEICTQYDPGNCTSCIRGYSGEKCITCDVRYYMTDKNECQHVDELLNEKEQTIEVSYFIGAVVGSFFLGVGLLLIVSKVRAVLYRRRRRASGNKEGSQRPDRSAYGRGYERHDLNQNTQRKGSAYAELRDMAKQGPRLPSRRQVHSYNNVISPPYENDENTQL